MLHVVTCIIYGLFMMSYGKTPLNETKGTDNLYNVATIFYSSEQLTAETGNDEIKYLEIGQCDASAAGYTHAILSIIAPENYNLDPDAGGVVILEISTCKDSFNSNCTFVTNYEWAISPTVYTNISWPYVNGDQVLYLRYMAFYRETPFSILLTYANVDNAIKGNYNPNAFPTPYAVGVDYELLHQYIKSSIVYNVANNHYVGFLVNFCKFDPPCNYNTGYKATATVVSELGYSYSAFNLMLCGVASVGANVDNCRATNRNYAVVNQEATTLVSATIDSSVYDLSQGLYVVVQGEGAQSNGLNYFLLTITTNANSN